MGKFEKHKYWKHKNCLDVFICVTSEVFDENGKDAILRATWCTQFQNGWGFTVADRVKITPKEYKNWEPYTPKGKIYL